MEKYVPDIFIDTDIILDMLGKRLPFYIQAASLFSLCDRNKIFAYVSSLTFTNLFYILRKQSSSELAIRQLMKFKTLVNVLNVDDKIIELALASGFKDFEDAVQYYTARQNNIKYLITRNIKDYSKAKEITVCTAEEYIGLII